MDVTRDIDAPATKVWEILTDTNRWPEWGPSVSAVRCADRFIGSNSRGEVRTAAGIWLPFRITRFTPGASWHWRVAGVTATGHRVESLGAERCRLVFELPLAAVPYAIVCRLAARRIAELASR